MSDFWLGAGFGFVACYLLGVAIIIAKRWKDPLPQARGRDLDNLARVVGVERRRLWWIFHESDKTLRKRVTDVMRSNGR